MKSRPLIFWLAVLFLFSGSALFLVATGQLRSRRGDGDREVTAARPVAKIQSDGDGGHVASDAAQETEFQDFVLTDQHGKEFDSTSLQGKVWVGSVFFSSCPSTCRALNLQVARLQQEYGDKGVEFVSITCDPDRDTPQKLADYSNMFGAKYEMWHFLTGDFDTIERVGNKMFGITVQREVHSDRLVLFDRNGKNRGAFRSIHANDVAELKARLDEVLAEDGTEPTTEPTELIEPTEPTEQQTESEQTEPTE